MIATHEKREWPLITWLPVLAPLCLLAQIIGLAIHVRLGLGHWPTPMIEDYKGPGIAFQWHGIILFGLLSVWVAIPLWLLLLCFRRLRISRRTHLMQAATYVAGWLLIAGFCWWNPYRFFTWLAD